ncbi:MAG: hypothetical protein AAGA53_00980 [Pseudomonadota bacterium]
MVKKNLKQIAGITSLIATLGILAACNSTGTQSSTKETLDLGQQEQIAEKPLDQSNNLRAFCPKTVIRAGTETYRTFADGIKKTDPGALNSLEFQSTITSTTRECNYTAENLNIRVGVRGRVINGPTGATGTITVPVRIAVASVAQEVLFSQLYQVPVTIPEGGANASFRFVESEIYLPVPERPNLTIFVGFDEGPPENTAQTQ